MLIQDIYKDDVALHDQIFDMSQDHDLNDKIFFDEYQDYEEEIPHVNDEQINLILMDGADLTDFTLECNWDN